MRPFFFITGLAVGSFLNVCIVRIPQGGSVIAPPSHCIVCRRRLQPMDLIPVVSYLLLRGRCRYCGQTISFRYPLIELITGLMYLALYSFFGLTPTLIGALVLASILLVVTAIDLEHYRIPDKIIVFGLIAGVAYVLWSGQPPITSALLGFMAGGLPLYLLAVTAGGMGGGDVKLAAMTGIYLGWPKILLALFLAAFLASLIGVALIAAGKKTRKESIPFGPFIAVGTLVAFLWGQPLISFYLRLFH